MSLRNQNIPQKSKHSPETKTRMELDDSSQLMVDKQEEWIAFQQKLQRHEYPSAKEVRD
jgi:hypothetical protein